MRQTAEVAAEKILSRLVVGDCWRWTGATSMGYGYISADGRNQPVHRVLYEVLVGPVPADMVCDHLCRTRDCVNPDHIRIVSHAENIAAGSRQKVQRAQTHCKHGHEYTDENTYVRADRGTRQCKTCSAHSNRRRAARSKATR